MGVSNMNINWMKKVVYENSGIGELSCERSERATENTKKRFGGKK